ncbi:MAG TPA: hypothetical protein VFI11_04805, partial [Anaerolineales bacterium]|nr:hypothetical protein [Anaerolineales bacterium]
MSFRRLVPYLTFLAVLAMAIRPSIDTDTWWHLRAGDWILSHGEILRQDVFSSTMQGAEWIYPGWLAQIVMRGLFGAGGLGALSLLTAVSVLVGLVAVWPLLEGPLLLRSAVLLLAAVTSSIYWSARPQILSFALTGITLWILDGARASPRRLWLLPVVFAVWANLHGGFAIGLILVGASVVAEILEIAVGDPARGIRLDQAWRSRKAALGRWVGWASISAVAVGVNPFGWQMLLYPWKTVSIEALQLYIQEWQSPDFHSAATQPFLAMLVLLLLSVAGSRRPMTATEVVRGAAFTTLGLLAARNIAPFALVVAPILARHLTSSLERWEHLWPRSRPLNERLTRPVNMVLAVALTVAAILWGSLQLQPRSLEAHVARTIPTQAFEWLAARPASGIFFHSYNWGGYVLWRLYP